VLKLVLKIYIKNQYRKHIFKVHYKKCREYDENSGIFPLTKI